MNAVVVYTSRYGNTKEIAQAIASGLHDRGPVQVLSAEQASSASFETADLVVIGGPTEQHGMTESVAGLFDDATARALRGKAAVGFDTRLRWPRWLSGSAGARITQSLRGAGATLIAPEESFFVTRKGTHGQTPVLEPGEPERATAWARSLADVVSSSQGQKTR